MDRDAFFERLAALPGAARGDGAFAPGPAIWAGRREIAHFDRDGALDVRLTKAFIRARRAELRANVRVALRPGGSDSLEFIVDDTSADEAVALVADALAANMETSEPGPPPTRAALRRRRRFH